MTLVEVLASLAILGTVLVGLVISKGSLVEQELKARETLKAVWATEKLLADWWSNPASIPQAGEGLVPGREDLSWRTAVVLREEATDLGLSVLELTVRSVRAGPTDDPLVCVEFLVPGRDTGVSRR